MNEYIKGIGGIQAEKKLLRELHLKELNGSNGAVNRKLVYSVLHKQEWEGDMEEGICGIWDGFGWIFEGTWEECFAEKHRLEVNYPAENYFLELS
jgi:hypothetical protein